MKCIDVAVTLLAFFYLTNPSCAFAQVTLGVALEEAENAVTKAKLALDKKKEFSAAMRLQVNAELVQIGRVLLHFNQMNAQEKRDCGKYSMEFFSHAMTSVSNAGKGTEAFEDARWSYFLGATALFQLDAETANDRFGDAVISSVLARSEWNVGISDTMDMAEKVQLLKNKIDSAIE